MIFSFVYSILIPMLSYNQEKEKKKDETCYMECQRPAGLPEERL